MLATCWFETSRWGGGTIDRRAQSHAALHCSRSFVLHCWVLSIILLVHKALVPPLRAPLFHNLFLLFWNKFLYRVIGRNICLFLFYEFSAAVVYHIVVAMNQPQISWDQLKTNPAYPFAAQAAPVFSYTFQFLLLLLAFGWYFGLKC